MNITGNVNNAGTYGADIFTSSQGCLVNGTQHGGWRTSTLKYEVNNASNYLYFDASKSWTGETSKVGSSSVFNNMQPYLSVYVWERTA